MPKVKTSDVTPICGIILPSHDTKNIVIDSFSKL